MMKYILGGHPVTVAIRIVFTFSLPNFQNYYVCPCLGVLEILIVVETSSLAVILAGRLNVDGPRICS